MRVDADVTGGQALPFAEQLRRFRRRAGLSQAQLATRAGLAETAIGALERGVRSRPHPTTLRLLADALGLSVPERTALAAAASPAPASRQHVPPAMLALPSSLPVPSTPLLGRGSELAGLATLLLAPAPRLVTLTGLGGTGKTRLALALADHVQEAYADGVSWIELASVPGEALVVPAIATALGVQESPRLSLQESVRAAIGSRRLLLVLDNCEHLVDACSALVAWLLGTCPAVRVLATSREPLQVAGEQQWPLPPLPVPEVGPDRTVSPTELVSSPAVELFVERARAIELSFALTPENALTVAEICRRLEGIPLALELAAARVRVLAVEQIRERLDDCFRLLVGSNRAAPSRQRTLRATLDWSYDLLTEPERAVLRRLAVFAGGCDLEAAESVCVDPGPAASSLAPSDVLDVLAGLVDKSLVLVESGTHFTRYRLLEPVRQYARQQLEAAGEADATEAHHAAYFAELAERAEKRMRGPEQIVWLDRLAREQDNLRMALTWSLANDGPSDPARAELGGRLAGALRSYWYIRSHFSEGRRWGEAAERVSGAMSTGVRARALMSLAGVLQGQGEYARATELCESSRALLRDVHGGWSVAYATGMQGLCALYRADFERAGALFEASLADFRASDDGWGIGWALANLSRLAVGRGEHRQALALLEEALRFKAEAGDPYMIAISLPRLGELVYQVLGDHVRATAIFEESLERAREVGSTLTVCLTFHQMARMARAKGDRGRTLELYGEALALHKKIGDRNFLAECLEGIAGAMMIGPRTGAEEPPGSTEDLARAARLFGTAEALREAIGAPIAPSQRAEHERDVAALREQLGVTQFEAAWAEGRAAPLEQVVAELLAAD